MEALGGGFSPFFCKQVAESYDQENRTKVFLFIKYQGLIFYSCKNHNVAHVVLQGDVTSEILPPHFCIFSQS
jgi:hypothetical protein